MIEYIDRIEKLIAINFKGRKAWLAKKAGVAGSDLSKLLNNITKKPSAEFIGKLAKACGVSMDSIWFGEDAEQSDEKKFPIGTDKGDYRTLVVDDDAMSPTIRKGDMVIYMLHHTFSPSKDLGLFVIEYDDKVMVRNLSENKSDYIIFCDNKAYNHVKVAKSKVRIIGNPVEVRHYLRTDNMEADKNP